jgi:hypothetical protein
MGRARVAARLPSALAAAERLVDLSKPESQTRAKHSKFFKGKGEGDKDKEKDKERKSDSKEEAARPGLKAERDTSRIKAVNSEAKPVTGVVKDVDQRGMDRYYKPISCA